MEHETAIGPFSCPYCGREYDDAQGSEDAAIRERIKQRLEYLRGELRAERISYAELHELQTLAPHIDAGDVELREAAGIPEFPEE